MNHLVAYLCMHPQLRCRDASRYIIIPWSTSFHLVACWHGACALGRFQAWVLANSYQNYARGLACVSITSVCTWTCPDSGEDSASRVDASTDDTAASSSFALAA